MAVPTDNVNLANLDAGTDNPASARVDLHNFGVLIKAIISAMGGGGATAWNSTNDGATSGLDADLLDGQHGAYYTAYADTAVSNAAEYSCWLSGDAFNMDKKISITAQDNFPSGIFFKPDGTSMYVCGGFNDTIYQYTLSTAWDVSTASYASKSKDVSSQDTNPDSLFFKPDGTAMYVSGSANDTIYQYTLSTAWDVSTASYASKSKSVNAEDTEPRAAFFKPDGTVMYVVGNTNDKVYQYTLSTAWDVSTASYASKSKDVSSQDTNPYGIFFKPDGTSMYITGLANDKVYQYTLSTAWDVSTASYSAPDFDGAAFGFSSVVGLFFSSEGSRMYVVNGSGYIKQYGACRPLPAL